MENLRNTQANGEVKSNNAQIIEVSIDKLSVPLSHPRRNPGNLDNLQQSIRKIGMIEPLTVCKAEEDDRYMVIDGTRRLTVLAEFGWKAIPCIVLESMPLGRIAHVSFVKNMERKSLSPIEIALHIRSMQEKYGYTMRDLDVLGYGSQGLISKKVRLLDLPGPVKDKIESGELTAAHGYELGKLGTSKPQERMAKQALDFGWTAKRLGIAIDNFLQKDKAPPKEGVKIPAGDVPGVYFKDAKDMSELSAKSVHLIITSPPYCVGMEYEKGISYTSHWENMKAVMAEASRVLAPGGIVALNVGDIHNFKGAKGNNDFTQIQLVGNKYQSFLRKGQIYLTDLIIWVKAQNAYHSRNVSKRMSDKTRHTEYQIVHAHEPVYIFRKKGKREIPSEEIDLNSRISKDEWREWVPSIWEINHVRKANGHPATFPDELVNRLVRMFSFEGDTVLDPFLGSGTTVKVARELGREAFGYERELQYKPVIMKKLGIAEENPEAGSMVGYAKRSVSDEPLEQAIAKAEAAVASDLFEDDAEVKEPVPAA